MTSYKNYSPNNYKNSLNRSWNVNENNFNSNQISNFDPSNHYRVNVNAVNQVNLTNNHTQNKYLLSEQISINQSVVILIFNFFFRNFNRLREF
jgi:hypothetical protein